MNRRYLILFGGIIVAALGLSLIGRMPRARERAPEPVAAVPRTTIELTIEDGRVLPAQTQVEKDHQVDLVIVNRGGADVQLTLSGYEDRVDLRIAAGERAGAGFLADRPGEGFAWQLNGHPAGRLMVTGSHLVEGHR